MTKSRDERVLALQATVEKKRKELEAAERFAPRTSCSITIDGSVRNLRTLNLEAATITMINFNAMRMSAENLGIDHPTISGYMIEDWIADLRARISQLGVQELRRELAGYQSALDTLLSEETKADMLLAEIEDKLK